jgi:serine/threonine protein kinase
VVLLDLDDAEESPFPGRYHPARPGTGGTIGWLAPEREMTGYNELADIWSIGVMAIEMIWGRHPWRQGKNPWRPGSEAGELQKDFHDMYGEAADALNNLHDDGTTRLPLWESCADLFASFEGCSSWHGAASVC